MTLRILTLCVALSSCGLVISTRAEDQPPEALPAGTKLTSIQATPAKIELAHPFQYAQVLLTGKLSTGETLDVTRLAQLPTVPAQVTVSEQRLVRPAKDGTAELKFELAGQQVTIPVTVTGQQPNQPVSFVRDVQPIMSKLGCNQGTCHGAAQGKNGFKLSLRGYDSLYDYRTLTDELAARRFNRAAPEHSLMLMKASGMVPHVGGVLTKPGEPAYEMLKQWIAQGVRYDAGAPRVTKIDVRPLNPVIPLPKLKQQMAVTATYSDGSTRDVTAEAFIESGNIEVLEANKSGVVTALRRGEAAVLVRYEGAYAATTITVMGDRTGFVWQDQPTHNYIDELVDAKLKRVKTALGTLCSDADFVRRVYLDLTGLPPSAADVRAFLADQRDSRVKREELIDRLVGNGDYVEHWTNKWADLLQVNSKFLGDQGAWALRNWIRQAIASNQPYDQFVREILTGSGSNLDNPPAAYHKILRNPDDAMENTTQLFLAVRFNCNKCHDHPFERWTQNQHGEMAAYFAQVARKEDPRFAGKKIGGSAVEGATPLVEIIHDGGGSEVKHPNTGLVMKPRFPYDPEAASAGDGTLRAQLAAWITSPKNEYFAKSYVNRLWSYLTGVGFIEPVDDIRAGNPPTNPELLDRLTKDFIDSGFDTQALIRLICKSRTYQLSVATNQWNADDQINYSHALARRLNAEVLYDAIYTATGSTRRLPNMPAGARAAEQRDPSIKLGDGFLELTGRPVRESACECERSNSVLLGMVLNLINGPTIGDAIAEPNNGIEKLVAQEKDDRKVVAELFLRILNRLPTEKEIASGVATLQYQDDASGALQAELAAYEQTLPAKQAAWEQNAGAAVWLPTEFVEAKSTAGATFKAEPDGSIFVSGNLKQDTYTVVVQTNVTGITGLRIEALADERLPGKGPGRADNGNFVLNEWRVNASSTADPKLQQKGAFASALADFSQRNFSASGAIDGNPATGWAVMPNDAKSVGRNHTIVAELKTDLGYPAGTKLQVELDHKFTDGKHNLGKFRLSVTNAKRPLSLSGPPAAIAKLLALPAAERTPEQQAELAKHFRAQDSELARLTQAVEQAKAKQSNPRLLGAQDLAWALLNSPAFLFNR